MFRWRWAAGLLLAGLCLPTAARAERVPSRKVIPSTVPNVRNGNDISVPYTTNGRTTLGVYQGVAPRIYASPVVTDPRNPGARPVFNIPFWGGVQSFGGLSNGAVPRTSVPRVGR